MSPFASIAYQRVFRCILTCGIFAIAACQPKLEVDTILYGAGIYTAVHPERIADAVVIDDGRIVAIGHSDSLFRKYQAIDKINLKGKFIYPGFNDGHAHFHGYSLLQLQVDLRGTASFQDVLSRTILFAEVSGLEFIEGRGWDQNDWSNKEFPTKEAIDSLFLNTPVLLKRVDGHAAIANQAALDYAGVTPETTVQGGVLHKEKGELTGLLIDNAVDLVVLPKPAIAEQQKAVLWAQDSLLKYGITSVTDAGIKHTAIEMFRQLQEDSLLKIRINAMVADYPEQWEHYLKDGPIKGERLQVICFKVYMDGALGSRGALLLEPYSDDTANNGLLLHDPDHFFNAAKKLKEHNWQLAIHAIGDSANRYALDLFEQIQGREGGDHRWRIEHAQIVAEEDKSRFIELGVLPSVQPTHATSDMYWAEERLGAGRMHETYAFKDLMGAEEKIVFGTDFPVEHISPFKTFRAAVFRQDTAGYPPGGFLPSQKLGRYTSLRAMTYWPAYASFEEQQKGSLEPGKYADLVILDHDLMSVPRDSIDKIRVYQTWINGEKLYQR